MKTYVVDVKITIPCQIDAESQEKAEKILRDTLDYLPTHHDEEGVLIDGERREIEIRCYNNFLKISKNKKALDKLRVNHSVVTDF